jgi:hypothetical protein
MDMAQTGANELCPFREPAEASLIARQRRPISSECGNFVASIYGEWSN